MSTAACSASQQTMDPVRRPVVNPIERPSGSMTVCHPSASQSGPKVSIQSSVGSSGSRGLPPSSISHSVSAADLHAEDVVHGQGGPMCPSHLQVSGAGCSQAVPLTATHAMGSSVQTHLAELQPPRAPVRLPTTIGAPSSADTSLPLHLEGCLGSRPDAGFLQLRPRDRAPLGYGDHISASSSTSSQQLQGPKVTLPYFSGKSEWRVFWLQFERMARRFQWNEEAALDHLVSSLRDDALDHFAEEAAQVRASLPSLVASLERRFGDRTLPETYRANLQTLRKQPRESLEEYATRVRKMVSRAYPGIATTRLLESMTIEHLVNGLTDHNLMYDVLTKKPQTVEAALDLIQWHESCKGVQRKRAGVRQLSPKHSSDNEGTNVRRVNGKAYVTEERLHQFGRELKDGIVQELRTELGRGHQAGGRRRSNQQWLETVECYRCHNLGHFARNCPNASVEASPKPMDSKDEDETPLN